MYRTMQYPCVLYSQVVLAYAWAMDNIYEIRRQKLIELVEQRFDGVRVRFAEHIGRQPDYVSRLLLGRTRLGERLARDIEERCDLAPRALDGDDPAVTSYGTRGLREVPLVGAGMGGMPDRVWDDAGRPVGTSDEYAILATTDKQAFLVRVEGDSMAPRYNRGEYALVEPGVSPEIEDDVLVRLVSGETLLKRLLSTRAGYRLGSYSPATAPITVEQADVIWLYYVAHPVPARRIKTRA